MLTIYWRSANSPWIENGMLISTGISARPISLNVLASNTSKNEGKSSFSLITGDKTTPGTNYNINFTLTLW